MADIALSVAQTLLAALGSSKVRDFVSLFNPNLEALEDIVSTIRDFLVDVDSRNAQLSREQQGYIEKLKDALYEADDLFDELHTKAQLNKLNQTRKLSRKVRAFFSSDNPILSAANTSREVKRITERLDVISTNHSKFGFKFDNLPLRERSKETCSYVNIPDVIGRDEDVKAIVDKLVSCTSVGGTVEFLTIVGMGGLGKTTFAQLVYNDERIKAMFPFRLWVCVSDQDGNTFQLKAILSMILISAGHKPDDGSTLENVKSLFQQHLGGKQCLLVLDDVWTEDSLECQQLRNFLMALGMGSKVIATSRSSETARIIGNGHDHTYELQGLTEANSWTLFKLAAFGKADEDAHPTKLLEIGMELVKHCCNVPLAIKVVGSLLLGHGESEWRAFEQYGLEKVPQDDNKISSILKLSYDNLNSSLKACFSYCAIFPKDYRMKKETLINLWLAQGYIKPFCKDQSMIDAGNDHFSILLRRSFFQDVKMDAFGEVESCKIHDLMHDVAQKEAGREICVASSLRSDPNDCKIRHLSFDGVARRVDFEKNKLRSCVEVKADLFFRKLKGRNKECLRALSIIRSGNVKTIPNSLCKLLHLRYLSLADFDCVKTLPKSIAKLQNLQTLILAGCKKLRELPNDLSKLVNLKHLDLTDCGRLSYMPPGMDKLTCLEVLTDFYVAKQERRKRSVGQLKDLKALKNLRGGINIRFPEKWVVDINAEEGAYLMNMKHLRKVGIRFSDSEYAHTHYEASDSEYAHTHYEALVAKLKPPVDVTEIELWNYLGRLIPNWGNTKDNWATLFSNLVRIQISHCGVLEKLPLLSELEHLRFLLLEGLDRVEYIEDNSSSRSSHTALASSSSSSCWRRPIFYPSLEELMIRGLSNLKGWWRNIEEHYDDDEEAAKADGSVTDISSQPQSYSFPRLKTLKIKKCPNLISFPLFPNVETLELSYLNEKLEIINPKSGFNDSNILLKLRDVRISHVGDLRALPPCNPTAIHIYACSQETFSGSGVEDEFRTRGSSSVRHLHLTYCHLKSVAGGGFQHLTALESIHIKGCWKLILNSEDNNDGIAWTSLQHSLLSFRLWDSHMERLPKGMQYLTSLQHLNLYYCYKLEELPEWISCLSSLHTLKLSFCEKIKSIPNSMLHLTSLHRLDIWYCSKELDERCRRVPQGEDFPKIQHIPQLSVKAAGIY